MKIATAALASSALMIGFVAAAAAQENQGQAQGQNRVCAQGTYSWPCPKVVWCPTEKCGIGIARTDGDIDVIYSSEAKMSGVRKKPVSAGQPLTLQHVAGRVLVFEWESTDQPDQAGAALPIKDIFYVIMPSPEKQ